MPGSVSIEALGSEDKPTRAESAEWGKVQVELPRIDSNDLGKGPFRSEEARGDRIEPLLLLPCMAYRSPERICERGRLGVHVLHTEGPSPRAGD